VVPTESSNAKLMLCQVWTADHQKMKKGKKEQLTWCCTMTILRKKCFITRQSVTNVLDFSSNCNNTAKILTKRTQTQEHK
jgi:hypothetical protein